MSYDLLELFKSINKMQNFNKINVELKLLHENFKNGIWNPPRYATSESAACDFLAAINKDITISPNSTQLIPTGLSIWVNNPNYVLLLLPRSGKGCNQGIVLGNSTGVIDSDYQGPLLICVLNRNSVPITISPGDYIAQGLLIEKTHMFFNVVDEFSNITTRGENGFGHTG